MKNFTTLYCDILNVLLPLPLPFHCQGQRKYWPLGNIDLPGSPYSLHGYSGRLVARSNSIKKA
jgi:hypothetical protein